MNIKINLLPDFKCVFMVNGEFIENTPLLIENDEICYITVLPLSATLLPYTVKTVGAVVLENTDLADCCKIGSEYCLLLSARPNYVYAPLPPMTKEGLVFSFFDCVKSSPERALTYLSDEMKKNLGVSALTSFFEPYEKLFEFNSEYFLADKKRDCVKCVFSIHGGKIDDIQI